MIKVHSLFVRAALASSSVVLGFSAGALGDGPPEGASGGDRRVVSRPTAVVGRSTILQDDALPTPLPGDGPPHEATRRSPAGGETVAAPEPPPSSFPENPKGDGPGPSARWIKGYWDWDADRRDFAWVSGTWAVPPPGRFWVDGRWKRDERGWVRIPGSWSERRTDRLDYRAVGPPAEHPPDDPGPAPGAGMFYVPGRYQPDGDGVVWKPGFWAREQPGWTWLPGRWVRESEGWDFREGRWQRDRRDGEARTVAATAVGGEAAVAAGQSQQDAAQPTAQPPVAIRTSPLVPLADQLIWQVEDYLRVTIPTVPRIPEGQGFLADTVHLRDAAYALRRAAEGDPAGLGPAYGAVLAHYQSLAQRIRRVAGRRNGPYVQRVMNIGGTCAQLGAAIGAGP